MQRRIYFFISAFALSGLLAAVLRFSDFSSQTVLPGISSDTAAVPSKFLPLRPGAQAQAEPFSEAIPSQPNVDNVRNEASPAREVVVRAVRNGHEYGWIQLPRGTRVELIRNEGSTALVRYEEVLVRVSRGQVEAGMVVPIPRNAHRWASL